MKIEIPYFAEKKELFNWLAEKHDDIIYAKKSEIKEADGVGFFIPQGEIVNKSVAVGSLDSDDVLHRKLIINTTNIRDSHKDVHIPGLWKKSLSENTRIKHTQEHQLTFDKIIADKGDLKAYTQTYKWAELGWNTKGETEALVFDSTIKKSRNAFMFKEYQEGRVDNHSVGMQYVKIFFAMNSTDPDHTQYKENYDKFIDSVANKEETEADGYFWAVTEAKVREGSSVVDGSNPITPTMPKAAESTLDDEEEVAEKSLSPEMRGILKFLNY